MQLEGCFIIISSNLNRKNKQKLENLVHIKFKYIVFYKKNFVENFFKDQDSSNFTGRIWQRGGTGQRRIRYLFSVYLKHKNILSPIKVYTKPENAILYQFPEGGNLAKLYDIRTNGCKVWNVLVFLHHFSKISLRNKSFVSDIIF